MPARPDLTPQQIAMREKLARDFKAESRGSPEPSNLQKRLRDTVIKAIKIVLNIDGSTVFTSTAAGARREAIAQKIASDRTRGPVYERLTINNWESNLSRVYNREARNYIKRPTPKM